MPRRDDDAYVEPSRGRGGASDDDDAFDDQDDFLDDDSSGDDYRRARGGQRGARGRTAGGGGGASRGGSLPSSSRLPAASRARVGLRADEEEEEEQRRRSKKAGKGKGTLGGASHRWEATYQRTWDAVEEDASGSLASTVKNLVDANKRRRTLRNEAPVQRGIIRHLVLIIDLSEAMLEKDMRPNRWDLSLQYSREFVNEYFDQNPIGQLAVLATRDGIAERIIPMGGNTMDHVATLSNKRRFEPRGEPSLQNALEMARSSLSHLPASNSREVLIIFGSLTTSDPGNIHDTMAALKRDRVRVSMVSLAAEMKIAKEICVQTGGSFGVALNEGHFRDLLFQLVAPPEVESRSSGRKKKKKRRRMRTTVEGGEPGRADGATEDGDDGGKEDDDDDEEDNMADLMQMGFPLRLPGSAPTTLCSCHSKLRAAGFLCPRCGAKMCEVPTDCPVCGLTIVMSTHLARSYHHLFPVPNFVALGWAGVDEDSETACYGCAMPFPSKPSSRSAQASSGSNGTHGGSSSGPSQARSRAPSSSASRTTGSAATATTNPTQPGGAQPQPDPQPVLAESSRYACQRCGHDFCLECDAFIHEGLFLCPGCGS